MTITNQDLRVSLYARVSSEQQAVANTIASQVAELRRRIAQDGCTLDDEACFLDEGVSGSTLLRPALERLRDQIALGVIDRLYVLAPDRLARKVAHQSLLIDEFCRAGVDLVFLNHAHGKSPEDDLLLQVQAVIAEYERAKIAERSRRGKLHAARQGNVNVLSGAPLGYRYVTAHEGGGQARYEVVVEEAGIVQQMFAWVGRERVTLREVCRRLEKQGILTRAGCSRWHAGTVAGMLKNRAYLGEAQFGKTRLVPRGPRKIRRGRGWPEVPRRPSTVTSEGTQPITIPVPALIDSELFAAAQEQLQENKIRSRASARGPKFLLQGLLVCPACGYAWYGQSRGRQAKLAEHPTGRYCCSGRTSSLPIEGTRCAAKTIRIRDLDEAVWRDVKELLRHPERLEAEYERRLNAKSDLSPTSQSLTARIGQLKRGIGRLIDAYRDGFLEKAEFEPQMRQQKERLARLEAEAKTQAQEETQRAELRLLIGQLEDFTTRMSEGLEGADWPTRREIIRALVKQIEVTDSEIKIVYKVNTVPFDFAPKGAKAQDCRRRVRASFRKHFG
jgi:site-specific DNA recombinase